MAKLVSGITDAVGLTSVRKDRKRAKRALAEQTRRVEAAEQKQRNADNAESRQKQDGLASRRNAEEGGEGSLLSLLGGALSRVSPRGKKKKLGNE